MTTFSPGDRIEYFRVYDNTWQPAKYIGPRDGHRHAIETTRGDVLTVGPHRCRHKPQQQQLTGHLMVFTAANGKKTIIGPLPDQTAINRAREEWSRIYPEGPDAVLDITALGITYNIGDGVPPLRTTP